MDPIGEGGVGQFFDGNAFEVHVDDEGVASGAFAILFLLLFLVELIEAERRDVGAGGNARNLSPQVIRFVAWRRAGKGGEEEGSGDDVAAGKMVATLIGSDFIMWRVNPYFR